MKILKSVILLLSFFILTSCNKPEIKIPDVDTTLDSYLKVLSSGDKKQFEALYFIPLHWRNKQKLYKYFKQLQSLYRAGNLSIQIQNHMQSGRWAVAITQVHSKGTTSIEPLWLFFYNEHWQIISRVIFHTSTVRSMMNTDRKQDKLRQWYLQQKSVLENIKPR